MQQLDYQPLLYSQFSHGKPSLPYGKTAKVQYLLDIIHTSGCGWRRSRVSNDIDHLLQPTETIVNLCSPPSLKAAYPHRA